MAQPHLAHDDAAAEQRRSGITFVKRVRGVLPGPKARIDASRRVLVPLLVALVPLWWICDATYRASLVTIGRDQGIFQYIAWAVRTGDVDYRDVRDVNGPLVHLIHFVLMAFGGHEEHRFQVLHLAITGVTFAIAGACLAGFVRGKPPTWLERGAWAAAGWVILSGQYQLYLYWNQAQRETFCDWFLVPALALQVARPARTRRAEEIRIAVLGALSVISWFGKPSFALFTIAQVAVLLWDGELVSTRRVRLVRFAIGGAVGAAIPLLYLVVYGDAARFFRISMHDVPAMYRFIWVKSPHEILGADGPLMTTAAGMAAAALVAALVAMRELPRRAIILALAPPLAVVHVLVQAKGFGYHFHPLTAATSLAWLTVIAMLWQKQRFAPRRKPLGRWLALAAATTLAFYTTKEMNGSPNLRHVWLLAGAATPYKRGLPEYFDQFKSYDFFPWDMRLTAEYLAAKTKPDERVQVYGMDPYVLYLARRKSATPYIYAYDLNVDTALDGGWWAHPTDAEAERIKQMRFDHEMDMLARLKKEPPPAFVFISGAPLLSYRDALEDFAHCCGTTNNWVHDEYRMAKQFGEIQVWLRKDLEP
jgi:hypothetical protein